jgi:hypothetical protein
MVVPGRKDTSAFTEACRGYAVPFILLLAGLYANTKLVRYWPNAWGLVPVSIAIALARVRFSEDEKPVVRLWQWIGAFSALYSLVHFPLMPPEADSGASVVLYRWVLIVWAGSVASGLLCFRMISLSILPPAFLLWINLMAENVTGLRTTTHIDVQPLTEVSLCIGVGLVTIRVLRALKYERPAASVGTSGTGPAEPLAAFAPLLLLTAIAVHLANYFWSFWAKMTLQGPPGAWLTDNNPAYMFLVALDDGHIFYSGYTALTHWLFRLFDLTHRYTNFFVLACQAAALIALLLPRGAFLVLLLMFDVLHGAIIVLAGANFWPWIILNAIITLVVAGTRIERVPPAARLLATLFILIAPHFVYVTRLGWYDSGANNKLYFEALDEQGHRYAVPTNFFTFYSYSLGHMDYGLPDPATAFAVRSPNGASYDYDLFKAGRRCDVARLTAPAGKPSMSADELAVFVKRYHRLAMAIYDKLGQFPYDLYPHHFYVPFGQSADFRLLNKRRIVAYVYRRESVCLSYVADRFQRRLVSSAEYRIDVD